MFVNYEDGVSVVFKVPTPGIITTDMNWGYYIDGLGWWDLYLSSTWTRTSTSTEPSGVPSSVDNNFMQTFKEERRADR